MISRSAIFPSRIRISILRTAGIKMGPGCFIGANVYFDEMRPELIEIGSQVTITSGTRIISHFFNPSIGRYQYGKVTIGSRVFIGMNTLIVNSVDIGERAVLAAGSVVTKDIPGEEIWGGNPARFIRKRQSPQHSS
ncbi:MAG: acyltransferase [Muribaculaceae bacterium]|nr:acyltransferase [Muribaculaceae bacterium]MDE6552864.1 acyltransferase [Muribaculaceae bacterium]